MALTKDQMPDRFRAVVDGQIDIYRQGRTIQARSAIPDTTEIPIEDPKHWLRIPDVICVFVDMKGSTQLSAQTKEKSTAGAYQLFTGTAVRLFNEFECPYIDVRGDGVFALFNSDQAHRALAAAVTFKTAVKEEVAPRIRDDNGVDVGGHYGIDRKTVLVRKIGLKRSGGRSDRQNEVWAGKPVNMAAKLAAQAGSDQLIVSDRYYAALTGDKARNSCGCPWGTVAELWTKMDVSADPKFDFSTAYSLSSIWCAVHGKEYCDLIIGYDK